jgi:uncharacterized protein with ParB-like and HNH nuclease domain
MAAAARSAFQTPLTIEECVENVHRNHYLLPAIQREFVWDPEQIVRLFDSVLREYPIGSFLFWNVSKEKIGEFQFYEFVRDYNERTNTHNPKASVTGDEGITCILDGQQRLTALYLGMKGSYASKIPWKRWDNPDAFPPRKLYLNLLSRSEEQDLLYDFRFLTTEESSKNDNKTYWFEVGKILDLKEAYEVNDFLIDKGLGQEPKELAKFANQTLFKLFNAIHNRRIIDYYLETSQELDKVLRIFIRVNSGGTLLSYSDLLLSIATAQWKTRDARNEITTFVDEINRIGEGFAFDKDFILKSCLVLSDITDIAFKVDNFNVANMKTIEGKWEEISSAIRLSVELISSFGYNVETLTSANAVIPIAYYLMKLGSPTGFPLSERFKEDRDRIRKWLTVSLLKRSFGGTPDSVLRPIREITKEGTTGYPFSAIVEKFKGTNKSITITEEDIENILLYEYGDPYTFSALSLLYPTLDLRNRFHQDHIFPKSSFRKPEMKRRGIPEADWDKFQEVRNRIGNLQLLEGLPNVEKSSKDFKDWLEQTYPNSDMRTDFMRKNLIPENVDLSLDNFFEFFEKRNELIRTRLKEILQTKSFS